MSVFTTLEKILGAGEALNFNLRREAAEWVVLVQPVLGSEPDDLPDAAKPIRANLSVPLVLRGTTAQIEEQLTRLLTAYGEQRARTMDAFNTALDALRKAEKSARGIVAKKGGATVKKTLSPSKEADADDDDDDDHDSEADPAASATATATPSVIAPTTNPNQLF